MPRATRAAALPAEDAPLAAGHLPHRHDGRSAVPRIHCRLRRFQQQRGSPVAAYAARNSSSAEASKAIDRKASARAFLFSAAAGIVSPSFCEAGTARDHRQYIGILLRPRTETAYSRHSKILEIILRKAFNEFIVVASCQSRHPGLFRKAPQPVKRVRRVGAIPETAANALAKAPLLPAPASARRSR